MKVVKEVLHRNRMALVLFLAMFFGFLVICWLYRVSLEPAYYAGMLAVVLLMGMLMVDYMQERQRAKERSYAKTVISDEWHFLPEAQSLLEKDYQEMIASLGKQIENILNKAKNEKQEMLDYYTAWVHQIKTPIAVMRLKLCDDTPEHYALSIELQRIERYVEMVLQYIRINSDTNDLVIRECSLDALIKEAVKKLATQFVEKKLRLSYTPVQETIVTDAKWFSCILDQILGNAIKYTPSGTITIAMEDERLVISDTGIGIAKEDLPRIFEMGYTGMNGRIGQSSSGLGLYLAKKAANLLAIPMHVESKVSEGSSFILDLRQSGISKK